MSHQDVALLIISAMFGICGTISAAVLAADIYQGSMWAYFMRTIRGTSDVGVAREQRERESDVREDLARTYMACTDLIDEWDPAEGSPLHWSLHLLRDEAEERLK